MPNLNDLRIPTDGDNSQPLTNFSTSSGNCEVLFRNLEERLIQEINEADLIVGCVAWLTNRPILNTLANKKVSIVVQKEDFLRPDGPANRSALRTAYGRLNSGGVTRYSLPGIGSSLSYQTVPDLGGIHCVGNHNENSSPAHARMHNKFVIFCRLREGEDEIEWIHRIEPYKVWTGSFNFTHNANDSFENAVLISDPIIADAYLNEFVQIYALSENLDWETAWSAPIRRIGS